MGNICEKGHVRRLLSWRVAPAQEKEKTMGEFFLESESENFFFITSCLHVW